MQHVRRVSPRALELGKNMHARPPRSSATAPPASNTGSYRPVHVHACPQTTAVSATTCSPAATGCEAHGRGAVLAVRSAARTTTDHDARTCSPRARQPMPDCAHAVQRRRGRHALLHAAGCSRPAGRRRPAPEPARGWPGPSPARNLRPTRKRSRAVSSSLARGPPAARASVPRPTALLVTGHSSCRRSASADRCVVSIRSPSSADAGAAARGPAGRWLKASRPVRVAANLPHGNELQVR